MDQDSIEPLKAPNELEPIERDQFSFAFNIAVQAGHYKIPVRNPEQFGLFIEDEGSGKVTEISLRDHPLNRAGIALLDHFEGDEALFHNFMMRFFALMNLMNKKSAKKWIKEDQENSEAILIHPALVYTAAEYKLKENGRFPVREFLRRVRQMADSEFSQLK